MASIFDSLESPKLRSTTKSFDELSKRVLVLFPTMQWDLRRAGTLIDPVVYISGAIYFAFTVFIVCLIGVLGPSILLGKFDETLLLGIGIPIVASVLILLWFLLMPKLTVSQRGQRVDKDLEYMLRDMDIQTSAGIPVFDSLVNISSGGYGECSSECKTIVKDVESGKSLIKALDDSGMATTSEYFRRTMFQLVNAMRSGADVSIALRAIANDLTRDKRVKIKTYSQELNMFGLIYMLAAIVLPSMGITLLIIVSTLVDIGKLDTLLWVVLIFLVLFQFIFISIVRGKRPNI